MKKQEASIKSKKSLSKSTNSEYHSVAIMIRSLGSHLQAFIKKQEDFIKKQEVFIKKQKVFIKKYERNHMSPIISIAQPSTAIISLRRHHYLFAATATKAYTGGQSKGTRVDDRVYKN
jgi:hypothetical protein